MEVVDINPPEYFLLLLQVVYVPPEDVEDELEGAAMAMVEANR